METQLSFKAFWDALEQRLTACSAEELRAIVRALARATPPPQRQAFLDTLQPVAATAAVGQPEPAAEGLLADIDTLADELQEALDEADDWDEYDEEDSLGPYEEFVEPLTVLFDRTATACDAGNMALARTAYHNLFEVLSLEDDYGRGVRAEDLQGVDMGEARAHYLRAVYATELPTHRPAVLFEAMIEARSWLSGSRPMFNDIIQIAPQPLSDQEQFWRDWIAFLRPQSSNDADAWLREAVRLSQGTTGLETLARTEGEQRPRTYLDWCAALEAEGNHQAVLAAAQEALRALPEPLPIRAAVADYLCAAALHLHDTTALRVGRWEAFIAKPTLTRLLDVWEVTPTGAERTGRMHQAAQHMQQALAHPPSQVMHVWEDALESPVWPDKSVLAHAYFLAGDWDAAYQLAAPEQVLGWSGSHNPQGLVVSCFLVQLSGTAPGEIPPNLAQLWHWELQNSTGFVAWHSTDTGEASLLARLRHAYMESLPATSLPEDQQADMLAWCLDVAQRRIDAIVSNQHRGSYDKAALLLAACAELLRLLGKAQEAAALLDDVRQRFPRHRAFQAEVQAAVRRMGG
jgi:tetratricopeptide (TPR) repeat protein